VDSFFLCFFEVLLSPLGLFVALWIWALPSFLFLLIMETEVLPSAGNGGFLPFFRGGASFPRCSYFSHLTDGGFSPPFLVDVPDNVRPLLKRKRFRDFSRQGDLPGSATWFLLRKPVLSTVVLPLFLSALSTSLFSGCAPAETQAAS